MKIARDISEIEFDKKSAVTVGTFDGVHLGHRQIIKELNKTKEEKGLMSVIDKLKKNHKNIIRKQE